MKSLMFSIRERILSKLGSHFYKASIPVAPASLLSKLRQTLFQRARALLVEIYDPEVEMQIHGRMLRMKLSHELPMHIARAPLYDTVILRIADYLRTKFESLAMIDIGANIGDTILAAQPRKHDAFLAVEPSSIFYPLLVANLGNCDASIKTVQKLVGKEDQRLALTADTQKGTAKYIRADGDGILNVVALDSIVRETGFAKCNFLKVDTDGFDLDCILGAWDFISLHKPFILFEADFFSNPKFSNDLLNTLEFLRSVGYSHFLIYTHVGDLFMITDLSESYNLLSALFYQATAGKVYYDVLAIINEPLFVRAELNFFQDRCVTDVKRLNALAIAEEIMNGVKQRIGS